MNFIEKSKVTKPHHAQMRNAPSLATEQSYDVKSLCSKYYSVVVALRHLQSYTIKTPSFKVTRSHTVIEEKNGKKLL